MAENMASFQCDGCEKTHYPFGRGQLDAVLSSIAKAAGPDATPPAVFRLPIVAPPVEQTADSGAGLASAPLAASELDQLAESLGSRYAVAQAQAGLYCSSEVTHAVAQPQKRLHAH